MTDTGGAAPRRRALVTLADVAWPLDAGKRLRAFSVIRALAVDFNLDVVVLFADADPDLDPTPPGVTARTHVLSPALRTKGRALRRVLAERVPWQTAVQDWDAVRAHLLAECAGPYDLVWFGALDHFDQLAGSVTAGCRVVDCDDVETSKLAGFVRLSRHESLSRADRVQRRIEIPMWRRIERRVAREADRVVVCSELDRRRLLVDAGSDTPDRVVALPNTYPEPDVGFARIPSRSLRFVVIANYGTDQNLDAATWAADEIAPQLQQSLPGSTLRFVGRRTDRIEHLRGAAGTVMVGAVESVAEELSQAFAVIVPIRFGGGTRLKILEALAYGVPVITTTVGCEGIESADRVTLVADTARDIASAAVRLTEEPGLVDDLTRAGHELYRRSYSPEAATTTIRTMLAK